MARLISLVAILLAFAVVFTSAAPLLLSSGLDLSISPSTIPITYGATQAPVGTAVLSVDTNANLIVSVNLDAGWSLKADPRAIKAIIGATPIDARLAPGKYPLSCSNTQSPCTLTNLNDVAASLGRTLAGLCDLDLYVAIHLDIVGPAGQSETAWIGSNPQLNAGSGNFRKMFTLSIQCTTPPPPPPPGGTSETAFAIGLNGVVFYSTFDELYGRNVRWGWQIVIPGDMARTKVGELLAGQTRYVGDLWVTRSGDQIVVEYIFNSPYTSSATHLYARTQSIETQLTTVNPGGFDLEPTQLNHDVHSPAVTSDTYTYTVSGNPVYIVAHATVNVPASA
ncbi:hypothetical protein HK102_006263 [Quaeritorhiza haematococci]|nr:hypothetical protein HK102_006263 [Quaeritorhiza haematococci]